MPKRAFAIRPAFGVHLQKAQVHPELNFFFSVLCFKFADDHLSRLVFPMVKKARYVEVHEANMDGDECQVNALKGLKRNLAKQTEIVSLRSHA